MRMHSNGSASVWCADGSDADLCLCGSAVPTIVPAAATECATSSSTQASAELGHHRKLGLEHVCF